MVPCVCMASVYYSVCLCVCAHWSMVDPVPCRVAVSGQTQVHKVMSEQTYRRVHKVMSGADIQAGIAITVGEIQTMCTP